MNQRIDLTENRDFNKRKLKNNNAINFKNKFHKLNKNKIYTIKELLYSDIKDENDYFVYETQHCDRCGKLISRYPWNIRSTLCEHCNYVYMKEKNIRINPFIKKERVETSVLPSRKVKSVYPWFIRVSNISNIDRIRNRFNNFIMREVL